MGEFRLGMRSILSRLARAVRGSNSNQLPANFDRGAAIEIRDFDGLHIAYRAGTADEDVLRESFDHDIFFTGVPEYQPDVDDVILDVGAHIGTFAVLAASKAARGRVHAIEAAKDSFVLLRINGMINRLDHLFVHHVALSDSDGTVTLFHDRGNWGHSTVATLSSVSESVASLSLASFMRQNDITRCDFMKLNCEGAEFPVLLSAPVDLLARFGVILVLYHSDLWGRNSELDLVAHLHASGFETRVVRHSPHRGWIVANRNSKGEPAAVRI